MHQIYQADKTFHTELSNIKALQSRISIYKISRIPLVRAKIGPILDTDQCPICAVFKSYY